MNSILFRTRAIRRISLGFAAFALIGSTRAQAQRRSPSEWEPGGRKDAYVHDLVGIGAAASVLTSTTIDQFSNDPPQWGGGIDGFAQRFASNAGRRVVQESVRHGLAAVMHRSVRYENCTCKEPWPRIQHAVVETVTDRDRAGDRFIAIPRFAGAIAGSLAESAWRPNDTFGGVVSVGVSAIVFGTIGSLSKEFLHFGM